MSYKLENKTIVVTGGARGIGYEIANHCLKKLSKMVIILDVNEENGKQAIKKFKEYYGDNKAVFIKCDVTKDIEDVSKKIIDSYKPIDVLINNAGIFDELDRVACIETNVIAVIEWSMKFREHMRIDKGGVGGTIVNISSIFAYRVYQFVPTYHASKFAVLGFTKSLGHMYNFGRTGVRIFAICPGFTYTNILSTPSFFDSDTTFVNDFHEFLENIEFQTADDVGKATVDIYEKAVSGSSWVVENGAPIKEVKQDDI